MNLSPALASMLTSSTGKTSENSLIILTIYNAQVFKNPLSGFCKIHPRWFFHYSCHYYDYCYWFQLRYAQKTKKDTYSGKSANLSEGICSRLKAPWQCGCTNSAFNFPDWAHWLFYLICCRAKPRSLTLKVTEWKATRVLLLLEGL